MKLSSTAFTTSALCMVLAVPMAAQGAEAGVVNLRPPAERPAPEGWEAPTQRLRLWVGELSEWLVPLARPYLQGLRWRGDGVPVALLNLNSESPLLVERTRTAVTAQWRPWTMGHWALGAAVAYHRALPGAGGVDPQWVAMPMASYEQTAYRVSLGLVPPGSERASALLLSLNMPLQ